MGAITTLVVREGDTAQVGVFGELDLDTGPELTAVLTECLGQGPARLVVDVSAVPFCDSSGLAALLRARESASRAGAEFVLAGVRPALSRILVMTGLDAVFNAGPRPEGSSAGTVGPRDVGDDVGRRAPGTRVEGVVPPSAHSSVRGRRRDAGTGQDPDGVRDPGMDAE
ncbi:STAS domain-containing protein [Streptomyces sp. NPDC048664]|uniref:STAS domain-containing protein n=1 Tax=Streptomyces sp. NPDC048664 TaxID=3154505 RepID=UPI00341F656B